MKKNNGIISVVSIIIIVVSFYMINAKGDINKSEVVVFAAASLTESFSFLKEEYEKTHLNVEIVLNFAGSQVLKNQIQSGATASMFFSANMKYPEELVRDGILVDNKLLKEADISIFAKNQLIGISSVDKNYEDINELIGVIDRINGTVILAHEQVPVGKYTLTMLDKYKEITGDKKGYNEFLNQVVSYEDDVKAVLAKIKMKEADFGVVYGTDAKSAGTDVKTIVISPDYNEIATYGSLLLINNTVSNEFYDYVVNGEGQSILEIFGFLIDE